MVARAQVRGYTLIEILMILFLAAIMAALTAPSLIGLQKRYQVNDAATQLQNALQKAQLNAIRKSEDCMVNFGTNGSNPATITSPCFLDSTLQLESITMKYALSSSSTSLTYNYKGETNRQGTIVVYAPGYNFQKCLVISNGIGMLRAGEYDGADAETEASPSSRNCTTLKP
jgi:Tfp pilus assembly protein FimT